LVRHQYGIKLNAKYSYSHSFENWIMIKNNWEDIIKMMDDFFISKNMKNLFKKNDKFIIEFNDLTVKNHMSSFLQKSIQEEMEKIKKIIKEIETIVDFDFSN